MQTRRPERVFKVGELSCSRRTARTFAIPEMWSGILMLGPLGYTFNAPLARLERRALRWHYAAHAGPLS
jgi:hypothetical protein